jgi:hypothetical protein
VSTTAAETPTSNRPAVTWRNAVTPLSRASRRRWTACFALLLALLGAGFVSDTFAVERTGERGTPIVLFVALPIVFGMLRRGTRRIAALDHPTSTSATSPPATRPTAWRSRCSCC